MLALDCRMKTQTPFVRTERAVHLNAEAAIHPNLAFIVNPRDAELDHAFRFDDALENLAISIYLFDAR